MIILALPVVGGACWGWTKSRARTGRPCARPGVHDPQRHRRRRCAENSDALPCLRAPPLALCALAACGSGSAAAADAAPAAPAPPDRQLGCPCGKGQVVIGTFDFGESKILANLYSRHLDKAGYDPRSRTVGAREITEPALEKGSSDGGVDVVPEYLATFTEFLNSKKNGKDAPPPSPRATSTRRSPRGRRLPRAAASRCSRRPRRPTRTPSP